MHFQSHWTRFRRHTSDFMNQGQLSIGNSLYLCEAESCWQFCFWNIMMFKNPNNLKFLFAKPEIWEVFFPHPSHLISVKTYWVDFLKLTWIYLLLFQLYCCSPQPVYHFSPHSFSLATQSEGLSSLVSTSLEFVRNMESRILPEPTYDLNFEKIPRWVRCMLPFENTDIPQPPALFISIPLRTTKPQQPL